MRLFPLAIMGLVTFLAACGKAQPPTTYRYAEHVIVNDNKVRKIETDLLNCLRGIGGSPDPWLPRMRQDLRECDAEAERRLQPAEGVWYARKDAAGGEITFTPFIRCAHTLADPTAVFDPSD